MIAKTCPCCHQPMHTEVSTSLLGTNLTAIHTCLTVDCEFETVTLEAEQWAEVESNPVMWQTYAGMKRRADERSARMKAVKFG